MTGFAGFIQGMRPEPDAGATMEEVLGRASRRSWYDAGDAEPEQDADEKAAGLLARGYAPSMISDLSRRLAEVIAELEGEREKIARGERRQQIAAREHAAGRADAWQVQRMLDGDFGDQGRADQLARRAASLTRQLEDAAGAIAPAQQRAPDQLEEAGRHAHRLFAEITRQRVAEAQASRPEPRPFADSVSRGAGAEQTGPCQICANGKRRDAARASRDAAPYEPGAVITTEYAEIYR